MSTLNLGILAHVDAGKTTLTERLLFAGGVIDEVGSVDDGSTQTDTLALERQRGITIKSAVASFGIGDVTVNLIDTPGHPDFIAEVERVLSVLDGAVLVISAVEGVQAQTRVLMRTLQRLRIPTVIFVNKIDRGGADCGCALRHVSEKLTPATVAMGSVSGAGTRDARFTPYTAGNRGLASRLADVLTHHNDELLAAWVENETAVPYRRLRRELVAQSRHAVVHPVFFGSAITGAGVDSLMAGIRELLPAASGDADGPVSGTVFKVERGPAGEKIAYVRMFSGTVRTRDVLRFGRGKQGKVTAISVFGLDAGRRRRPVTAERRRPAAGPSSRATTRQPASITATRPASITATRSASVTATRSASVTAARSASVTAGQIGKLWGLGDIQIGDAMGLPWGHGARGNAAQFPPPTLETVVVACRPAEKGALHVALSQLAEQDPLINLRQDDVRQEILVSLYGEVQKEVVQATLANDFGIDVGFRESTTICIERPVGAGAALEIIDQPPNPFLATIGLRVDPAPVASGVRFRIEFELGALPRSFLTAVEETVRRTLLQGVFGWEVTDCTVTMTHSGYWPRQSHAHATFDSSMSSTAGDFRNLTPLVLMSALKQAGTVVCEPVQRFALEIPADTLRAVVPALALVRAVTLSHDTRGPSCVLEGEIPAAQVHSLDQQLPRLTRGESVLECTFSHYRPVRESPPARPRTDNNPLNRKAYLLHVMRGVPD